MVKTLHSQYSLVQSQQWKHQNNVWNPFKVNNVVNEVILVSLLLTLNKIYIFFWCSIVDLEQVNEDFWKTSRCSNIIQLEQTELQPIHQPCTTLREKCPYLELFWSHFPAFGLNTKRCGVSLRIQPECRKMRTRITPNTDTFYPALDMTQLTNYWESQLCFELRVLIYVVASRFSVNFKRSLITLPRFVVLTKSYFPP